MKAAWAAVAVVLGLLLGTLTSAEAQTYQYPADSGNPVADGGCAVRFDTLSGTGNSVVPRIHANGSHYAVGCASVAVNWATGSQRELVLQLDDPGVVVGLSVDEDETLVARGINCGGSGGSGDLRIYCYDRQGNYVPSYSLDLYGGGSNLWLSFHWWDAP